MARRSVADALDHVPRGARVVVGAGCGTPTTLLQALAARSVPDDGIQLWSGLLAGDLPTEAFRDGRLDYHTWHVTADTRDLVREGHASFHPLRGSDVPAALVARGVRVVFVRVTQPDRHGFVSLGPSVSFPRPMIERAAVVIGEVDETLPRTAGRSLVHRDRFAALVPSETATPEYHSRPPGETARRIAKNLLPLLPREPALQLGIGEVPEALTALLHDADLGSVRCVGMGNDAMVGLMEAGVIDACRTVPDPAIAAVELMGTRRLLDAAHENPAIGVYPVDEFGDPRSLGTIDRFVSVNSAVQVDLHGQVNAEWVAGQQISGLGGSLDFVESAWMSVGGVRVLALASTSGRYSRIVTELPQGTPVSLTRHLLQYVVTEHGVADLSGASTAERIDALLAIADPGHAEHIRTQLAAV